ncbi:MAG: serine hydrolase [Halioglobus sp.]
MSGFRWCLLSLCVVSIGLFAYPMDGYEDTGIRRLEQARLTQLGELSGTRQPPGALLTSDEVNIRLQGLDYPLPSSDEDFSGELTVLLGDQADNYALAVLDLTDPNEPVYAEHRGKHRQNVGSVGKLVAALGLFQGLADTYPATADRENVLRNTTVTADRFSHSDHHTIRLYDVETKKLTRRPMRDGDTGSLWEYLDWTLSVSSNSAAAMTMRDAMLLRQFGTDYPLPEEQITPYFDEHRGAQLTQLYKRTFWEPVTRNGFSLEALRQGSFFTREGKKLVDGGGLSYATARSLMRYLLAMEQGRLVDPWTSTQLKRLLYVTERRIRYASAPALRNAAVYFKSGSLYSCKAEEGFKCGAYKGNVRNYMNSVAIVEENIDGKPVHYLVTLVSNVLRENSAVAHQTLGGEIHAIIKARHATK